MEEYIIDGAFVRYGAEDVPLIIVVTDLSMCACSRPILAAFQDVCACAKGTLSRGTTELGISASCSAT